MEFLTFLEIFEFCCCHSDHKYLHSYNPKQESEHIIYLDAKDLYGDGKFQPIGRFKWIDSKEFGLSKYNKNSLNDCVQKVEYSKELLEWHHDYSFAPDEIESKKEMSIYQLTIAEFCNIGIVKRLDKRKVCASLKKLETRIKTKKSTSNIRIQSITVAKTVCQI